MISKAQILSEALIAPIDRSSAVCMHSENADISCNPNGKVPFCAKTNGRSFKKTILKEVYLEYLIKVQLNILLGYMSLVYEF